MLFKPFSQRKTCLPAMPDGRQAGTVYLDYAAGSQPNPSSIHAPGMAFRHELQEARESIAKVLAVKPDELVFTSGGTESNNLAILGVFRAAVQGKVEPYPTGEGSTLPCFRPHIITSNIEHSSVLGAVRQAEREGAEVSYLKVRENGVVDISDLESLIRPETVLISLMHANNETGTLQPVREVGRVVQKSKVAAPAGGQESRKSYPYFHVDACQTAGYKSIEPHAFCADFLTVSGQKVYGPRGTGFLFVKNGTEIEPLMYGGGQERGLRPGTENVEGQIEFAKAFCEVQKNRKNESERLETIRQYFVAELVKLSTDLSTTEATPMCKSRAIYNGSVKHQLPNIVNISFMGIASDRMVLELDAKGIAVSAGSACHAGQSAFSQIITAIKGEDIARSAVRFSFGKATTAKEIDIVVKAISDILGKRNVF